jgi:16S rRNA (cytosine967-C5)-methyltransferase
MTASGDCEMRVAGCGMGNDRTGRRERVSGHPRGRSADLGPRTSDPGPRAGPRDIAFDVLRRVETTGAFANLLLDSRLRGAGLSAADRSLATELTYGVLRWRGKLDWILTQVVDRPLARLHPVVLALLRLGIYQVCCLDRVPAFAAVDETVSLARRAGAARSAGFVNAVLRATARRDFPEPDEAAEPLRYWSTVGSHPAWLAERWLAWPGRSEGAQLMAANNRTPPLTIAANLARVTAERAAELLQQHGVQAQPGALAPWVFRLHNVGSPADLPGFAQGLWIPMDEGGTLPVLALGAEPGHRVLDACAGGGGKTALLAAAVAPGGEVLALDKSPRALQRLGAAAERLGLTGIRAMTADARTAASHGTFSRVLLDAPCTGLGTVRRRPEIKWRRRPADLAAAQRLQQELLAATAEAVAPGGVLVYSTCSLEPEETDDVIAAFLAARQDFLLDDLGAAFPSAGLVIGGVARAWPHRHDTDGFFVARLRRSR